MIIAADNFDREDPRLVAFVRDAVRAVQICALLNEDSPVEGSVIYRVVDNNYKLRKSEP
jgi:hypothetical protein